MQYRSNQNKTSKVPIVWQPGVHVNQNIFEINLMNTWSPFNSALFGTFSIQIGQKLEPQWLYEDPRKFNDRLNFAILEVHLIALYLVPFLFKLVKNSSHSDSMKIRENSTIAWILLRNRGNHDFYKVSKDSLRVESFVDDFGCKMFLNKRY